MCPKLLLRLSLGACAAIALAGCGHRPITSMVKLAPVDFETSDPAELRAAIKLPQALRTRPNGVSLRIAVRVERAPEEARDVDLRTIAPEHAIVDKIPRCAT